MAMISVTYADALIACFDAKYHYAFWRPITAIRAGDVGNARIWGGIHYRSCVEDGAALG